VNEPKVSYAATGNNIEQRLARTQNTLILLFLFIVILPFFWKIVHNAQITFVKEVDIVNLKTVGDTTLCPGEKLVFTYDLKIRGAGVLVRDLTVWRTDPPKTIIYSSERRFILNSAVEQKLKEAWLVPKTFINYDTAEVEDLPPGNYVRLMSISSPTLSTVIDTDEVAFTVESKEHCQL
jgi:hypothetical protein